MRFTISTGPTSEPITIADFETQANTGDLPEDQHGRVADMLTAARELCESRNKRQFITATWLGYLDSFPTEILIRDKLPITGITSIQYYDSDDALQTLSASLYTMDYSSPNAPARIMPSSGNYWPITSSDVYNAVIITFTAGYGTRSDVPLVVRNAMLMLVAHWYENREVIAPIQLHNVPFGFDELLAANDWGWYG